MYQISYPSFVPYFVPKYQSRSVAHYLTLSQHNAFLRRGVVSTSPNPQAGGPPLVGCPLLFIQYFRSYPPYWKPFLHPQPKGVPCRGDRDQLITAKFLLITNLMQFFLCLFIHFVSVHVWSITVLIIRGSNCINTSSGMISLCKWLLGMSVRTDRRTKQSLTQTNHTRWCINTIRPPDDEQLMLETCRVLKWINKYMKKCIRLVINKNLWRDTRLTKYKIMQVCQVWKTLQKRR